MVDEMYAQDMIFEDQREARKLFDFHCRYAYDPKKIRRLQKKRLKNLVRKKSWKTKDGIVYKISEMKTSHIKNTLKCFGTKIIMPEDITEMYIKLFNEELKEREAVKK